MVNASFNILIQLNSSSPSSESKSNSTLYYQCKKYPEVNDGLILIPAYITRKKISLKTRTLPKYYTEINSTLKNRAYTLIS